MTYDEHRIEEAAKLHAHVTKIAEDLVHQAGATSMQPEAHFKCGIEWRDRNPPEVTLDLITALRGAMENLAIAAQKATDRGSQRFYMGERDLIGHAIKKWETFTAKGL